MYFHELQGVFMDFEEELRKFVQSDMPLRQTREKAHWKVAVWMGDEHVIAEAQDLSRGGMKTVIQANSEWCQRLIVGSEVLLEIQEAEEDRTCQVQTRVVWVQDTDENLVVGFKFVNLDHLSANVIERYLLAQVVSRHLEDDKDV